jgi:hypothetical protein
MIQLRSTFCKGKKLWKFLSLNIFLFLENRVKIGIEHKFIKLRNVLFTISTEWLVRTNINHNSAVLNSAYASSTLISVSFKKFLIVIVCWKCRNVSSNWLFTSYQHLNRWCFSDQSMNEIYFKGYIHASHIVKMAEYSLQEGNYSIGFHQHINEQPTRSLHTPAYTQNTMYCIKH